VYHGYGIEEVVVNRWRAEALRELDAVLQSLSSILHNLKDPFDASDIHVPLLMHETIFFSLLMVSPQPLSTRPLSRSLTGIISASFHQ
jgi:hypothetical protein